MQTIEVNECGNVVIRTTMSFRKSRRRKRIITPGNAAGSLPNEVDRTVLQAFARAYRWQAMLDSGRVASIAEIATLTVKDGSYIRRILHLCELSPNIVRAFLAGIAPDGLSLEKLRAIKTPHWAEQERLVGL